MSNDKIEELKIWYKDNEYKLKRLAEKLKEIMLDVLISEEISYANIYYRVKDIDSLVTKAKQDKYNNPSVQIQDYVGLRIVAYVESDVKKICDIIEQIFEIDKNNSEDKSSKLGIKEVGYRSVHYVAKLGEDRGKLKENIPFKDQCFEIQVRTLLQHTWAEIEHDRGYKFSGELPKEIKRKFSLIAGTLELLDNQFDSIANQMDSYEEEVSSKVEFGGIRDIEINGTSLKTYLDSKLKDKISSGLRPSFGYNNLSEKEIIEELGKFGIETLGELDNMISKHENVSFDVGTYSGAIRYYMLLEDAEKYINTCWGKGWSRTEELDEFFKQRGIDIESLLRKYNKI